MKAGLKVTAILAAEFIRFRDGFVTIVEGGWELWEANSNPFRVPLPLFVEIDTGTIDAGSILDLKFVVRSPDGLQVHEQRQTVTVHDNTLVHRPRFGLKLEFSGSQSGLWCVQVLAGSEVIGEFPIEIRAPAHE